MKKISALFSIGILLAIGLSILVLGIGVASAEELPDLTVSEIKITPSDPPSEGESCNIVATITNVGGGTETRFYVSLYIDDSFVTARYIDGLDGGFSKTVSFSWTASPTVEKITIKADKNPSDANRDNKVVESDETNNELSRSVSVSKRPTPTPSLIPTPIPTPTPKPVVVPTPTPSPSPSPTPKPGELYVHLHGHKTNVIVGEEVILYLSVINPITSPGTLKVQLTLQVPSGWSITAGEFSPPVGGFQTAVYDIEQGHDTKTIGIHVIANQPFDGVITGYTDYYFVEEPENKHHKEVNEPVTAKEKKLLQSHTPRPAETPAPKAPGFEAILALAGILAVAYLLRRRE